MADLSTPASRRRLAKIYRNDLYEIMDRRINRSTTNKTQTVASAIREMRNRGFSIEAIYKDLEDLCINTFIDIDYFYSNIAITPPSHFECNR